VIKFGRVSVYNVDSFNNSRNKILRLTAGLGFDSILSTKIATFFSELCRPQLKSGSNSVLDLSLEDKDGCLALSFSFSFDSPIVPLKAVQLFFDGCTPSDGTPSTAFYAYKFLSDANLQANEYPINELIEMVEQPSLDELMVNITNKNAELEESEKRIMSVLEGTPDSLLMINQQGIITFANSQAVKTFGYSLEELLGKAIEMLVPEEIHDLHKGYVRDFFANIEENTIRDGKELVAVLKNGERISVDVKIRPIKFGDENYIIAAVRDITLQLKAQESIKQLSQVVEQNPISVAITDVNGKLEYVNPAFCEVTGYSSEEVLGLTPSFLSSGNTPKSVYKDLWETILQGKHWKGKFQNRRKNREEYWESAIITPIFDKAGVITHFVSVKEDITERLKAQQELDDRNLQLSQLSEKLSKYLSPQVYQSIFSGEREVSLSTERKKLTVFFSDIKDFTSTTDDLEPEDITFLLTDYLTEMSKIALEYGATIDKFIGDAMLLFFGDPTTMGVQMDALTCVRMAITMQRRMVSLRAKWVEMGYVRPFQMRIGINTGFCNVGNFGSEQRMDYTIIGGEVNLAARLEGVADPDGIMLSYETYLLVKEHVDAEACEPINVKGIHRKITPYRLIGIYKNVDEEGRFMRAENDGMKIFLDFDKLDENTMPDAIRKFETALEKLRTNAKNSGQI